MAGIACTFSTLGAGLTPMVSTRRVGITYSVLSPVRFLSVDIFPPVVVSSASGIFHKPLFLHYLPHNITFPLYVMFHPILVKFTVHPASHNVVTDISECVANLGILCAHRAFLDRLHQHTLLSRVEVTRLPFGNFAVIGFNVCLSSSIGASVTKKWLVAPLSKIAHCLIPSKLKSIVFSNECAACK